VLLQRPPRRGDQRILPGIRATIRAAIIIISTITGIVAMLTAAP